MPVVVKVGSISTCPHGKALVNGWGWDFTRQQNGPIDADHMVDILGAQYGLTRVPELYCCAACQSVVTC